jgi:ABC-type antimicrobial peptide transport system permease subunit
MINTVALTISRKKELALLRVLGMSQFEVQLSFLVECMLTAVIGGAFGTALASGLGIVLAKDPSVSLLPFLVCIVSTMLISGISIFVLSKGSTIHNPME